MDLLKPKRVISTYELKEKGVKLEKLLPKSRGIFTRTGSVGGRASSTWLF
jgi:hypothetical protein